MKKMNKKGFTLVELLTVIAILAIILLIAAPTILNVLDKAKKNTFKNQVLMYVEGLKKQVALETVDQADMTITWDETGKIATVNVTDIPMDSDALTGGTITVTKDDNGKATYKLTDVTDGKYTVTADDATKIPNDKIVPYKATTPTNPES